MATKLNLNLQGVRADEKKISNNTLKPNDETEFTIPFEGIMITEDQACALMQDPYFYRSVFNNTKGMLEPVDWLKRMDNEIVIHDRYALDFISIEVSGQNVIEFKKTKADKEEDETPAGRLTAIRLRLAPTGVCELKCHVSVRPGLGRENLLLQEHQHREVKLSMLIGKLIVKEDSKQQSLNLGPAQGTASGAAMGRPIVSGSEEGAESASSNSYTPPAGAEAEGSETPGNLEEPQTQAGCVEPDGEAESQASPAELVTKDGDECPDCHRAKITESHCPSCGWEIPTLANGLLTNGLVTEAEARAADAPPTAEELLEFERAAQSKVAAHRDRHPEVLDGRSERVKHEDRKRARRGAH